MTETKICTLCKKEKPLLDYYRGSKYRSGYSTRCKDCICRISRDKGWGHNSEKQRKDRKTRQEKGICRVCKEKAIVGKITCELHYIVDVASNTLKKADKVTAKILLQRFKENPYCPYTGEHLILGTNAHLDHIKSKKQHPELIQDINNVEWISEIANLAKTSFNKDEFIEFCKLVAKRFN